MTRVTCRILKCRRWKNLDEHGACPEHVNTDSVEDQEVCKCSKCTNVVIDDDLAINCDLCDKWYHLKCTNVHEELYQQLDPAEGDPPLGIQWYCNDCLPIINNLIKNQINKKDGVSQTVNKGTQFDRVKVPVCEEYRHGTCAHGMSGKKCLMVTLAHLDTLKNAQGFANLVAIHSLDVPTLNAASCIQLYVATR